MNDLSGRSYPGDGARIGENYKLSLKTLFEIFPDAPAAIIMEEDLLASPDFYK